jgi:hypothetical protein
MEDENYVSFMSVIRHILKYAWMPLNPGMCICW